MKLINKNLLCENIQYCILDESNYQVIHKKIMSQLFIDEDADDELRREFINQIKATIKDRKKESKSKFLALLLLKAAMMERDVNMFSYLRQKLLARLRIFAEFKCAR